VIVVRAADREQALRQSERLDPILRELVREQRIDGFEMASHFLPSAERQERRRSALPDSPTLRKALGEAVTGLPFKEGLFEPFIRDVDAARTAPLLEVDAMRGTALHLKVESLLFTLQGEWIALIPLRGLTDGPALLARLAATGVAGVTLLDLRAEAAKMIERYRLESVRLSGLGIAAMLLLLLWGLGSLRQAVRVLLPVVLAVVIEVGIFLAAAKPMTVFHLVSLLFVVGTGLNYALFFSRTPHDPDERRRTLLAITVCFAATLCAAACLAVSATPVLHAIGLTVLLGNPLTLLLSAGFGRAGDAARGERLKRAR
jgi:predicted exporter